MRSRYAHRTISDWVGFAVFLAWSFSYLALLADAVRHIPGVALFLLPSICCDLVIAIAFLIRYPERDRLANWWPRAAGQVGTWALPIFFFMVGKWEPAWLQASGGTGLAVGALVWFAGTALTLWTVWTLRHAFSIEPQARELVTTGPYRMVRHPIYASYFLQFAGLWLAHMTVAVTLAVSAWALIMFARMRFEEQILTRAFPEYTRYCQYAGRVTPRLLRPRSSGDIVGARL